MPDVSTRIEAIARALAKVHAGDPLTRAETVLVRFYISHLRRTSELRASRLIDRIAPRGTFVPAIDDQFSPRLADRQRAAEQHTAEALQRAESVQSALDQLVAAVSSPQKLASSSAPCDNDAALKANAPGSSNPSAF